jgi:hypothetical protein
MIHGLLATTKPFCLGSWESFVFRISADITAASTDLLPIKPWRTFMWEPLLNVELLRGSGAHRNIALKD